MTSLQFNSNEFLKYLFYGGTAAVVNFCSRIILDIWLSYNLAIVLAYLIGMCVAFILFRSRVFRPSRGSVSKEIFHFTLVNALSILQTLLVSNLLAFWLLPGIGLKQLIPEIAHMVGIAVPAIISYFGHKYLTFGGIGNPLGKGKEQPGKH